MEGYTLPIELIRQVFERAVASDVPTALAICRVCHTARAWTLPILYETIVLGSSSKIERFAKSQTRMSSDIVVDQLPALLVRKLWFGPSNRAEQHRLYSPSRWPLSFMRQILTRCTSLCSLAVINGGEVPLTGLADVIPASVSYLTLGPLHEPVDCASLPCARNLHTLNSIDSYMVDREIHALMRSRTSLRTVRRIFTYSRPPEIKLVTVAFRQIGYFFPPSPTARALERLEIVCYRETDGVARYELEDAAKEWGCDPARVTLVPRAWVTKNGKKEYFATFFEGWEREA
ncbi:hypothetical protein L227DRAFT_572697 [Lentinus tigrinus ALCF2SS1-6]|uniref:F-box domain-containing protein n=1 Tax=Lentinus tigrinus ALCF2SS1-6 TaxID=1328759 RepID=A0A5C2SK87_9APHY|nr:hypothetical protein L227DRAFT_572697 [Lentinus tigrinus ALCF2SS1-6]